MAERNVRALESSLLAAVDRRHGVDKIRTLLDQMKSSGLDVNRVKGSDGVPLLHKAIDSVLEDPSVVFLLLQYGANPFLTDMTGQTALHAAASRDNVEILATMLTGVDINLQDNNGETLLHVAARNRSIEAAEWLMFAGADPNVSNKRNQKCIHVVPKNCFQLKHILRTERIQKSRPFFLASGRLSAVTTEDGQFSLALQESSAHVAVMVRSVAVEELLTPIPSRDGETLWGQPVEFISTSDTQVDVAFALHDLVDSYHELVLRLKTDLQEDRDTRADIVQLACDDEIPPGDTGAPQCKAKARAHVRLDKKGSMGLVCRPVTDFLHINQNGGHVQSSVDPRVQVTVKAPEKKLTSDQTLQLQVEEAPPLEPAIREAAPSASSEEQAVEQESNVSQPLLTAMCPCFVKLIGDEDQKLLEVTTTLPLTQQFSGTNETYVYSRAALSPDQVSTPGDEVEKEMQLWSTEPQTVTLPQANSITVQTTINNTITVVQTSRGAPKEDVRREIASQHVKSRQARIRFHVFHRDAQDDQGRIHEVAFVVRAVVNDRSPANRDLPVPEGFRTLKITDVLYVPVDVYFRITAPDDVIVSQSSASAIILFQYGIHTGACGSSCYFRIKGNDDDNAGARVEFEIEKSKMPAGKNDQQQWKGLLHLELELTSHHAHHSDTDGRGKNMHHSDSDHGEPSPKDVGHSCSPTQSVKDVFSDKLLLDLANEVPRDNVHALGIQLGLTNNQVEDIMFLHQQLNMKAFKVLHTARQKVQQPKEFAKHLYVVLTRMELNETAAWLKDRLLTMGFRFDWDHFDTLPGISR